MVSIIAAMAEGDRAIGWRGGLPWHLPADLAHFRRLTTGHAVIMGRVTWEPIAGRGLPGRRVIVLTRGDPLPDDRSGVLVARSLEAALRLAAPDPETFIAGGASVYQQALAEGLVDRMYLTVVEAAVEADAFFPDYQAEDWSLVEAERRPADAQNPFAMSFHTLERRARAQPEPDQESGTNDSAPALR